MILHPDARLIRIAERRHWYLPRALKGRLYRLRSNRRLHANVAIALLFHIGIHWRGVGEPCRYPIWK